MSCWLLLSLGVGVRASLNILESVGELADRAARANILIELRDVSSIWDAHQLCDSSDTIDCFHLRGGSSFPTPVAAFLRDLCHSGNCTDSLFDVGWSNDKDVKSYVKTSWNAYRHKYTHIGAVRIREDSLHNASIHFQSFTMNPLLDHNIGDLGQSPTTWRTLVEALAWILNTGADIENELDAVNNHQSPQRSTTASPIRLSLDGVGPAVSTPVPDADSAIYDDGVTTASRSQLPTHENFIWRVARWTLARFYRGQPRGVSSMVIQAGRAVDRAVSLLVRWLDRVFDDNDDFENFDEEDEEFPQHFEMNDLEAVVEDSRPLLRWFGTSSLLEFKKVPLFVSTVPPVFSGDLADLGVNMAWRGHWAIESVGGAPDMPKLSKDNGSRPFTTCAKLTSIDGEIWLSRPTLLSQIWVKIDPGVAISGGVVVEAFLLSDSVSDKLKKEKMNIPSSRYWMGDPRHWNQSKVNVEFFGFENIQTYGWRAYIPIEQTKFWDVTRLSDRPSVGRINLLRFSYVLDPISKVMGATRIVKPLDKRQFSDVVDDPSYGTGSVFSLVNDTKYLVFSPFSAGRHFGLPLDSKPPSICLGQIVANFPVPSFGDDLGQLYSSHPHLYKIPRSEERSREVAAILASMHSRVDYDRLPSSLPASVLHFRDDRQQAGFSRLLPIRNLEFQQPSVKPGIVPVGDLFVLSDQTRVRSEENASSLARPAAGIDRLLSVIAHPIVGSDYFVQHQDSRPLTQTMRIHSMLVPLEAPLWSLEDLNRFGLMTITRPGPSTVVSHEPSTVDINLDSRLWRMRFGILPEDDELNLFSDTVSRELWRRLLAAVSATSQSTLTAMAPELNNKLQGVATTDDPRIALDEILEFLQTEVASLVRSTLQSDLQPMADQMKEMGVHDVPQSIGKVELMGVVQAPDGRVITQMAVVDLSTDIAALFRDLEGDARTDHETKSVLEELDGTPQNDEAAPIAEGASVVESTPDPTSETSSSKDKKELLSDGNPKL